MKGISLYGRASQGVNVMNLRDDDVVSAVALVMEGQADTAAKVEEDEAPRRSSRRRPPTATRRTEPEPDEAG